MNMLLFVFFLFVGRLTHSLTHSLSPYHTATALITPQAAGKTVEVATGVCVCVRACVLTLNPKP